MTERPGPPEDAAACRTIGEVAEDLHVPQHVLRFWETRFPQIKPVKRAGGRRFYRPEDVALLRAVQTLLYADGYTIKGVQRLLGEFGAAHVADALARSTLSGPGAARGGTAEAPRADPAAAGRRNPPGDPPVADAPGVAPAFGAEGTRFPGAADVVARLRGVSMELAECRRLLSLLGSIDG